MNTFSTLSSPTKKLLNFEEFTPAKVIVGCDINGWFETHKKSPIAQPKRKPPKCLHMRINADNRSKQSISLASKPVLQSDHNNAIILSIKKLKVQMEAFSTKCKTSDTKISSIVGNKKSQEQIQVDVSAFEQGIAKKEELYKKGENPIDQFFHIYEINQNLPNNVNGGSMSERLEERKRRISKILSFNKMRNSSKPPCQNVTDFSKKLTLINKSQQIVKGKLSMNQQRALNQIVKQEEFNFIRIFNKGASPKSSSPLNLCRQNKIKNYRFFSNEENRL